MLNRKRFTKHGTAQYFGSVEDMYKCRLNSFISLAGRHLYNRDYAIDAVHDAFIRAVEYFTKNPDKKVREHIMNFHILKACKKINKKNSWEIPYGLLNSDKEIE